ncbi:MAG: hypothetical protein WBM04_18325, partial [Candidatus Korobacteraceae bacterium]
MRIQDQSRTPNLRVVRLEGHGFSRVDRCEWKVGLQPLREFAVRFKDRNPSGAKANVRRPRYGMA